MAVATSTAMLAAAGVGAGSSIYAAKKTNDSVKDSIASAERQRDQSIEFIENAINNAGTNIFKLYDSAPESLQSGLQTSVDLFKETTPVQMGIAQDASMAAQNAILQGVPRAKAALLGQDIPTASQPVGLQLPGMTNIPNVPQMTDISQLGLVLPGSRNAPPGNTMVDETLISER
jgi:hypothetical protein